MSPVAVTSSWMPIIGSEDRWRRRALRVSPSNGPPNPRDLTLRYVVTVGGPRPIMGQFVEAGDFAGTRGRALPLVGMTLEIDGPGAAGRQLMVESIFLGSPQTKIVGRRVVLAGPTGREPLVGLRVRVEPKDQPRSLRSTGETPRLRQSQYVRQGENIINDRPAQWSKSTGILERELNPIVANTLASPPRKREGRVRVFRSRSRQESQTPGRVVLKFQ